MLSAIRPDSAAKYVLQRVSIQQHNMLKSKQELSIQLLSIERNVFSVADANSLWMKLDETSKLVEEKLDMLNVNVNKIGETIATPPASAKPRKRKRGTGNGRRGTGSGQW